VYVWDKTGGESVRLKGVVPDRKANKQELDARFRASLLAYFRRRTGSSSEAEDLTQETFARLVRSSTFEDVEEAPAFVFRVAGNLLRDRAKASTRLHSLRSLPIDTLSEPGFEPRLVEGIDPERVFIAREDLAQVLAHLQTLGERTRNIFILFRVDGRKQKDIAALYGISVSAVEKHIMAATIHLMKRFGPGS
jgi:RNA polymerase sigma factor (sigma-70 family)